MPDQEISPKPLLEKLGAKPTLRMAALGFDDLAWTEGLPFESDLEDGRPYDLVVVRASEAAGLRVLGKVKRSIGGKGAFWVVYPRGGKTITQSEVMGEGNADGWTDVKVCRFSDTDTALKFLRRRVPR
jgi:hypothetical protein